MVQINKQIKNKINLFCLGSSVSTDSPVVPTIKLTTTTTEDTLLKTKVTTTKIATTTKPITATLKTTFKSTSTSFGKYSCALMIYCGLIVIH